MLNLSARGNRDGEMNLQTQPAPENSAREGRITNSESRSFTFTTCRSPIIGTFENVFKNLRKRLNLAQDAPPIGDPSVGKTNVLIWDFMSTTMKGAIHMGQNYNDNFDVLMNTNFEGFQNLLHITQKLVFTSSSGDSECEKRLNGHLFHGTRSTLSHDQVTKWTKSESTRILRFRLMPGENVRSF